MSPNTEESIDTMFYGATWDREVGESCVIENFANTVKDLQCTVWFVVELNISLICNHCPAPHQQQKLVLMVQLKHMCVLKEPYQPSVSDIPGLDIPSWSVLYLQEHNPVHSDCCKAHNHTFYNRQDSKGPSLSQNWPSYKSSSDVGKYVHLLSQQAEVFATCTSTIIHHNEKFWNVRQMSKKNTFLSHNWSDSPAIAQCTETGTTYVMLCYEFGCIFIVFKSTTKVTEQLHNKVD